MQTLEKQKNTQIARPRHVLAPLIHRELELAETAGQPHRVAAGALLLEAKASFKTNDEFVAWVERNFHVKIVQATKWMKWAGEHGRGIRHKKSPLTNRNNANWYPPVNEEMRATNFERIVDRASTKGNERALEKELAIKLISIGYKALAVKLHPDKGGSEEAMNRLNNVRDELRACYE